MFRVPVSALGEGLHMQTHAPSPEDLGLDPRTFRDVVVELRLDIAECRILSSFTVRAIGSFECDRTLATFDQPVSGDHTVLHVPSDQLQGFRKDEDVFPFAEPETEIDLTVPVRDTLLLAVPLRRVAPQAEEVELTTTFGRRNMLDGVPIDDRWEVLKKLREIDND